MDSLQDAIERARKEREGSIGQTSAPGESSGAARFAGSPEATPPRGSNAAHDTISSYSRVQYTETRQVQLDEDLLARNRIIAANVQDSRVEIYRQLRSQVLGSMKQHNWQTLSITSAHEGAGKTTTALNLAISMSQEVTQTVMLVDLDLRTPNVHAALGVDVERGIVEHLRDGVPLSDIMFNPGFPRLVIVPGTPQGHFSSEILSWPEMQMFLSDIKGRYSNRIIIFDLPPLLRNDDAMVFVPKADACLLVVEEGSTTPADVERCLELLDKSQILGTILNKAE